MMAQPGNGIENVQRHSALLYCSCAPQILDDTHPNQAACYHHGPSCSFRRGSSSTAISYRLCYSFMLLCSSAPKCGLASSSSLLWWLTKHNLTDTISKIRKVHLWWRASTCGRRDFCIAASWRTWQTSVAGMLHRVFDLVFGLLCLRIWLLSSLCPN